MKSMDMWELDACKLCFGRYDLAGKSVACAFPKTRSSVALHILPQKPPVLQSMEKECLKLHTNTQVHTKQKRHIKQRKDRIGKVCVQALMPWGSKEKSMKWLDQHLCSNIGAIQNRVIGGKRRCGDNTSSRAASSKDPTRRRLKVRVASRLRAHRESFWRPVSSKGRRANWNGLKPSARAAKHRAGYSPSIAMPALRQCVQPELGGREERQSEFMSHQQKIRGEGFQAPLPTEQVRPYTKQASDTPRDACKCLIKELGGSPTAVEMSPS